MKILFARPDVFVPLHAVILFFIGALTILGTSAWFLMGSAPRCETLPFCSAGTALVTPLFWNLRHARPGFPGTRVTVVLVAFTVLTAFESIRCRLGS